MSRFQKTFLLLLFYSSTLPLSVHAQDPAPLSALEGVFSQVISVILGLAGIAAVVMLVVGGYHYLMAGGDKEGAARARNTITYALVGLILSVSAWAILNLFASFLGITGIGTFNICWGSGC